MVSWLHFLLLKLPPETAHGWVVFCFKIYQRVIRIFLKQKKVPFDLSHLTHRLGLAAGFDKNAEMFLALSHFGFGFIEVGTVTPRPQQGNPRPRLFRVRPGGLVNHMGFNNVGVEAFKKNLKALRPYCRIPILANIGKNKDTSNEGAMEDYRKLIEELGDWVDGFVINVSSPNTVGLRDLQSISFLEKLEELPSSKPLLIKLAPDLNNDALKDLFLKIAESRVLAGCVVTNTSREIAQKDYGFELGGYSGEKLFERAVEVVALASAILKGKKQIIGVGGIDSPKRAQKMIAAGADAVELYTGFIYQGTPLIHRIQSDLEGGFSRG